MTDASTQKPRLALLGFSLEAMSALKAYGLPFVAVVPADFKPYLDEHGIPGVPWDFERLNEKSGELADTLTGMGIRTAVPLYEETVEWSGALNARFRDDPRLFNRSLLFRQKAMMKRKAQLHGIRVGVFEEADDKEMVRRFFKRVNEAQLKLESDEDEPVHLKPLASAGCAGHRMIRSLADIDDIEQEEFPCLLESHLDGQEFSCEVFVHNGKIRFLNITEYVHLGYSNYVPAGPALEGKRHLIREAVQKLIDAFGVEYGMIHPEFFIAPDDSINFGEVAARVPGGHIFELIEKAYGFNPFVAFALCMDPETSEEELSDVFPPDRGPWTHYAGCLMVYPRVKLVTKAVVPDELLGHDYYERHNLFVPATPKVADRTAFGDHYGTIYFRGEDPAEMKRLLQVYEEYDFYTNDAREEARRAAEGKDEPVPSAAERAES